jgi:hypothetical protein
MNSASPGGRAGKNAIDISYHTLNIQHVKVLSAVNFGLFSDELL